MVQRALQVSPASDWQTETEQRRERERMEMDGARHLWVESGFSGCAGHTRVAAAGKS